MKKVVVFVMCSVLLVTAGCTAQEKKVGYCLGVLAVGAAIIAAGGVGGGCHGGGHHGHDNWE